MTKQKHSAVGRVYLVGAGPGDPGLITQRGVECLRRADVVLYDYLVNPQILRHAKPACEQICLGRHGHGRLWTQDEINERLVALASQGQTVVRLKGGDPAVFARGAEETETLAKHHIPFEIVPGITAALAAGSCAGIPITHRDLASAVALITGQEHPDKQNSALDYQAIARFPGTLVFYMPVTTAAIWTKALIEAGKSPDTPAAIVRRCSLPDQKTMRCKLSDVVDRLADMRPPALVIVGPVTAVSETLSWFEQRPLFGQTILVTRPLHQSSSLVDPLAELGAEILIHPAIEISDPPDWSPVDDALSRLDQFDWLVFSSANGVRYLLSRLLASARDMRALSHVKLAAIGPGTADALAEYHLRADLQPPKDFRAESLAAALAEDAADKRFLLARASRGREVLADELKKSGGEVEQIVAYTSSDAIQADSDLIRRLEAGEINWITVTSSAIARSLAATFGQRLSKTKLVSISPITSETLTQYGLQPAAEATSYTMPGVVDAIVNATSR